MMETFANRGELGAKDAQPTCEAYVVTGGVQCGNCGYVMKYVQPECRNCGAAVISVVDEGESEYSPEGN